MSAVQDLKRNYEAINKANKGVSYYDRILQERQKDPKAFDDKLDKAVAEGQRKAAEFLATARNPNHPDQAATIQAYSKKYDANPVKVNDDMVEDTVKAKGAKRLEFANAAYENNLFTHLIISTTDEEATVSNLIDLFKAKHAAVGYDGDKGVLDLFKAENLPFKGTVSPAIRD